MTEDWLDRWNTGRTGWHEVAGNAGLKAHWPRLAPGSRVLVPLCGKSPDMLWLARHGCRVTGVELSEIAVCAFFSENSLPYKTEEQGKLRRYATDELPIEIFCGDYFAVDAEPFDALYDRGALVALPEEMRSRYVQHTQGLLKQRASKFIVTLEYDQTVVSGPPFSVSAAELVGYFPGLERVEAKDDIENCPPKFRAAGLREIREVFWRSASQESS
ncbi:MAG: thiopurine S-methyltransferase [Woeseiaceae bacterium]